MSLPINRRTYAQMYGPTVGDRIRLADTDLIIEVEQDATVYGDEVKFGGGKVLRDGMGQSPQVTAADAPDLLITNALIIDHWGIVKADIGIKNGRISAIGKAGNPALMAGVHPQLIAGVNTEVLAGEGMIITAGGHRPTRAFYLSAAHSRGDDLRHYHHARRRHGSGHRYQCDDVYARPLESPPHACKLRKNTR